MRNKKKTSDAYIIDTNFFFNMEADTGFGENTKDVIVNFTQIADKVKKQRSIQFYMPPSIVAEFMGFFEKEHKYVKDFLTIITIKSPDKSHLSFPAEVFYQIVEEGRKRSFRGLQVAEDEVLKAGEIMLDQNKLDKVGFQKAIGPVISKLRERYRRATRYNFLDSVADLDLIILARETDGTLVSTDEGVLRWGRIFGIREVSVPSLRQKLLALCDHKSLA